ncbi:hypothetical protein ACFP2F_05575 [Hymenobacter artigasi]|uniref:DNA-directed DNA polymerase family A palm domain-containing protein n=1 Tax=Hymenobacter artigasi TaxID=2719616 RepID=A0ABX1HDN2_9BACT|nr:hypothetical protein [Hymenobacter artigasi]NKI88329.1 hypothetical protein [Hymenobacter artigasi]
MSVITGLRSKVSMMRTTSTPSPRFAFKHRKHVLGRTFFLPPLLDVPALNLILTGQGECEKSIQGVLLLYSYLITHRNVRAEDVDDEKFLHRPLTNYMQVRRERMRSWLGVNYSKVVGKLLEHGYLEVKLETGTGKIMYGGAYCHWQSSAGDKGGGECKQYRIPAHLLEENRLYKQYKAKDSVLLDNKIAAARPSYAYREKYREYVKGKMEEVVLLDTPACRVAVQALYDRQSIKYPPSTFITLFNENPFRATLVCDFGHRLHDQVVNLPKSLRPFLRFKNDLDTEVVVVDMTNSQPFFLSAATPALIREFTPECGTAIPFFEDMGAAENYLLFKQKAQQGQVYELLRDRYNEKYRGERGFVPVTRDDAKLICYIAFFSNYKFRDAAAPISTTLDSLEAAEARILSEELRAASATKQFELRSRTFNGGACPVAWGRYDHAQDRHRKALHRPAKLRETIFKKQAYDLVKSEFADLHTLFRKIKSLSWDFNPGKRHANNALLAQRLESSIMYCCVVKGLVEAGITDLVTIHDAVLVKKPQEEEVRKIFLHELGKLNLFPQLN